MNFPEDDSKSEISKYNFFAPSIVIFCSFVDGDILIFVLAIVLLNKDRNKAKIKKIFKLFMDIFNKFMINER